MPHYEYQLTLTVDIFKNLMTPIPNPLSPSVSTVKYKMYMNACVSGQPICPIFLNDGVNASNL